MLPGITGIYVGKRKPQLLKECQATFGTQVPNFMFADKPGVTLQASFGGCCCRQRIRLVRLPRRTAVFPLVIGELFDLGAIVLHDEDLTVGLRGVAIECFVFEIPSGCW
jgi:hypothetical protein